MANDPPFATLNHVAGDLGIPSESALLRIGINGELLNNQQCCGFDDRPCPSRVRSLR
jgi:hypothetical protein